MTKKPANFITETCDVQWAFLHKADDKFGKPGNHNITIIVDDTLKNKLDSLQAEFSATKINGMRTVDDGTILLKAKSSSYTKKGEDKFPCHDANAEKTEAIAFGGDRVKLKLTPMVINRDNSMSFFLSGVQIIEKKEYDGGSNGFEKTEGFDGSDYKAPESSTESASEVAGNVEEISGDGLPF
jgi:hypothetical protein